MGVSEGDIEKLRVHDWAVFNSDRRYYEKLQDAGTYLEEVAEDTAQPEVKTVEEFLDSIENQRLYQVLIKVDRLTIQLTSVGQAHAPSVADEDAGIFSH